MSFSLPNFYFHATTAYDILRTNGVPLGKRDFMGRMKMKKVKAGRLGLRKVSTRSFHPPLKGRVEDRKASSGRNFALDPAKNGAFRQLVGLRYSAACITRPITKVYNPHPAPGKAADPIFSPVRCQAPHPEPSNQNSGSGDLST